jgi:hypothetical protein
MDRDFKTSRSSCSRLHGSSNRPSHSRNGYEVSAKRTKANASSLTQPRGPSNKKRARPDMSVVIPSKSRRTPYAITVISSQMAALRLATNDLPTSNRSAGYPGCSSSDPMTPIEELDEFVRQLQDKDSPSSCRSRSQSLDLDEPDSPYQPAPYGSFVDKSLA